MPDSDPRPDLGALIAQRLCHDLVNPLGAVGNGLDLLAMTAAPTPETELMRDSLDQALGRIKLYRLAFGPEQRGVPMPGAELRAILGALGGSRRLDLLADLPPEIGRAEARLVALMGLCAETALAWGGVLKITAGDAIRVEARAPRLRADPALWEALARGQAPAQTTPPLVHFALLAAAASSLQRTLGVETAEGRLVLTA